MRSYNYPTQKYTLAISTTSKLFLIFFSLFFMSFSDSNTNEEIVSKVMEELNLSEHKSDFAIIVSIEKQKLFLVRKEEIVKQFDVSTSKYGVGFENGSLKTPLGLHTIKKKIGDDVPLNGIFKYRNYRGDISIPNDPSFIDQDLITTRILWLSGSDEKNQLSYKRCIYIHGTPEELKIGEPSSHGCIRMRNSDIYALYEIVEPGTPVIIK